MLNQTVNQTVYCWLKFEADSTLTLYWYSSHLTTMVKAKTTSKPQRTTANKPKTSQKPQEYKLSSQPKKDNHCKKCPASDKADTTRN